MKNILLATFLFAQFYFIACQKNLLKIKTCDLTTKDTCTDPIEAGDTITYKCKYETKKPYFNTKIDYKSSQFCFDYVLIYTRKAIILKNIEDAYLGLFNISKSKDNGTLITTASITIPPILTENINFNCNCYTQTSSTQYSEKTFNVHVKKTYGNNVSVVGCNFNNKRSMFNNVTYSYNEEICNIANVKPGSNLALLCPADFIVQPKQCFQNVYEYKNITSVFKKLIDDNDVKIVTAQSILENELGFEKRAGDTRFQYATVPASVAEQTKKVFTCFCKGSSKVYRMNLLLNMTVEEVNKEITNPKPKNTDKSSKNEAFEGNTNNEHDRTNENSNRTKEKEANDSNTPNKSKNASFFQSLSLSLVFVSLLVLFFR